MGSIARSGTWDEASSPAATRLARRFEEAWRAPRRKNSPRPDPADFLPDGDESPPAAWLAIACTCWLSCSPSIRPRSGIRWIRLSSSGSAGGCSLSCWRSRAIGGMARKPKPVKNTPTASSMIRMVAPLPGRQPRIRSRSMERTTGISTTANSADT